MGYQVIRKMMLLEFFFTFAAYFVLALKFPAKDTGTF